MTPEQIAARNRARMEQQAKERRIKVVANALRRSGVFGCEQAGLGLPERAARVAVDTLAIDGLADA